MSDVPTRQEMFDRAVRGLAAQDWERSYDSEGCVYQDDNGRRCAWGHVDTSLSHERGGVDTLHNRGIGIAARLDLADREFAERLQSAHDTGYSPEKMLRAFLAFAQNEGLTWPEGVEKELSC